MASLTAIDWFVCVGYLLVVVVLATCSARGQKSNEEYFVGGRRMHWLAIGVSMFAGIVSSLSFVGLPREAAYGDYHLYLAILFIPFVATPVVAWVFVPLYHRLGVTSAYEYLERRFHRRIRLFSSFLYSLYTVGWIGTMLYAVGVILQAVLGLDDRQLTWVLVGTGLFATVYTTMGGVKAVVWTDVLQALTLGGGMIAILLLAVDRVDGGWSTVWRLATEHDKLEMLDFELRLDRANFYAACAYGIFVYLPGQSVAQGTVQRLVALPSVAAARRALLVNGALIMVICLLFFLVGTVLFAFYHQSLPTDAPAGSGFPDLLRKDHLMPHFVATEIPHLGLTGLLLAALFAAAMSSIDSGINSLTALVVCDWLSGRQLKVGVSRLLCFLFGIGVIVAALLVPRLGEHVFDIVMKIAGTFLGLLFGVFLLGLVVSRANTGGVVAGLFVGAVSLTIVIPSDVSHWWYGAAGCVPTFVVGAVVSPFIRRPTK